MSQLVKQGRNTFLKYWIRFDEELLIRWAIVLVVSVVVGVAGASRDFLPELLTVGLIGGILGLIALGVTQRIRIWLLAAIIFDISLEMNMYLSWQSGVAQYGTIAGLSVSITTFCLIALYGIWLVEMLVTRERPRLSPSLRAAYPLIPYVGLVGLSVIWAGQARLALFEFNVLAQMFLMFVYMAGTVRSKEDFIILALAQVVAVLYVAFLTLTQRFGVGAQLAGDQTVSVNSYRVSGPFGSENIGGAYLEFAIAHLAGMMFTPINKYLKVVIGGGLMAAFVAIVLMQSRGSWIGLAVGIVLFLGLLWARGWLTARMVAILITIILITLLIVGGTVAERLTADDNGAADARGPLVQLAFDIIADYPFLGVGANNFGVTMDRYTGPEFSNAWLFTVHNKYALVWSELGSVGLAAFLGFLITILYRGWKNWQTQHPFYAPISLGLLAGIAGHMAHFMVDIFNGRVVVQSLWIAAALISSIYLFHTLNMDEDTNDTSK